jgi:hypothetical protein
MTTGAAPSTWVGSFLGPGRNVCLRGKRSSLRMHVKSRQWQFEVLAGREFARRMTTPDEFPRYLLLKQDRMQFCRSSFVVCGTCM